MNLLDRYEQALMGSREVLAKSEAMSTLLSTDASPQLLHGWMLHFSAFGVRMTEPVEDWITRAGKRCQELGMEELGRELIGHAHGEAGHHQMMIEDARLFAAGWERNHGRAIDTDALIARTDIEPVDRYRELHEEVIRSDSPFRQLAIEYEIEMLSVAQGAPLVARCLERLPEDTKPGLSFLAEHAELDVGHTQFNRSRMAKFFDRYPQHYLAMVQTGRRSLDAYLGFIEVCLESTRQLIAQDELAA